MCVAYQQVGEVHEMNRKKITPPSDGKPSSTFSVLSCVKSDPQTSRKRCCWKHTFSRHTYLYWCENTWLDKAWDWVKCNGVSLVAGEMKSSGKVAPNNNIELAISLLQPQIVMRKSTNYTAVRVDPYILYLITSRFSLTMSSTRYATTEVCSVRGHTVAWFMIAVVWQYYLTICHLSHNHTHTS